MNLLEELGITKEELIERTIGKILELPSGFQQTGEEEYVEVSIHKEVKQQVNSMIKGIVESSKGVIQKAIDDAIRENVEAVFSKPFCKIDRFGDQQGETTTIRAMIADEATAYWTKKVDSNGNDVNGYCNSPTIRAEYYAKKFMEEFYSTELRKFAEGMAKEVKEKIPAAFAEEVAKSFTRLFK